MPRSTRTLARVLLFSLPVLMGGSIGAAYAQAPVVLTDGKDSVSFTSKVEFGVPTFNRQPPETAVVATTDTLYCDAAGANCSVVKPVPAPPPPTASLEPAGFVRRSTVEPSTVPPWPSANGWWSYPYPNSLLTSVSDNSAPSGDGWAWRSKFPQGLSSGSEPANVGPSGNAPVAKLYVRYNLFIEGTAFEGELAFTKLGFWGYAGGAAKNEGFIGLAGSGTKGAVKACWPIEYRQQGPSTRNLYTSGKLCAGKWQRWGVLTEINTIGAANGKLTIWVDGVQVGRWTDVIYQTAAKSGGFTGWKYQPIWGGNSGYTKSRTDYVRIDGVYVSGSN